jgi:hypothetical protein
MKTRRLLLILAGLVLLVLLATLVPRDFFSKPKDQSIGELATARGQIVSYSFLDDSIGKHHYTIHLSGYQATFQIPPDFAQYFAKARFESDLKKGDSVSLSIPAASAGKLITEGTIPVFAVRAGAKTYLDEHSTLAAYNSKHSPEKEAPATISWLPLIAAGSIILLLGVVFVIWKIARILLARSRKPKPLSDPAALNESSQRLKKILARSAPEQKPPAADDSEKEPLATGHSEQKPSEPPQA